MTNEKNPPSASSESFTEKPSKETAVSTRSSLSSESSSDSIPQPTSAYEHGAELTPHISKASSHHSHVSGPPMSRLTTTRTNGTAVTTDPAYEVDFEADDKGDPRQWSLLRRGLIIFYVSFSTLSVVMYSTAYASGIPGMMQTFHISQETVVVLGITTYMLGLALGSVVLAPLSEMYGRRPIYLITMALFTIFVLPCALAQNLETVLICRFFGAIAGSAMISNSPGTVADIVDDDYRALAFSIWSIGPMNGPVVGPVLGGFIYEYLSWRWINWVVMMCTGVTFILMLLTPETYAPSILRARAGRLRKENDDPRYWSRYDEKAALWPLLKVNLKRPFVMTVTEPICIFWDVYIAILYAILYLCFVAYPIVFSQQRGWTPGITGLSYVGIGLGGLITIASEPLFRKIINSHKVDPATGKVPPEAMVSVVCIAACLVPLGELWFAFTSTPNYHWALPIAAGIPFGAGNCAVFIYASNYLVHSYGIYAASALAGNSVLRSICGGTLPLAGPAMYRALGSRWAGCLLGLLEVVLIPIPFVFWRYGDRIRKRSPLIRRMREDMERLQNKKKAAEDKVAVKRERQRESDEEREMDIEAEVGGLPTAVAPAVKGNEGSVLEKELEAGKDVV